MPSLAFMMTRMSLVPIVVALALVGCDVQHTAATVQWGSYTFQEVRALAGLPPTIKSTLGVGRPGLDGLADRGQSFNVTDMVDDRVPMRRLLSAGRDGDNWIVALERGGRGYSVEVFLFSAHEAAPKQTRSFATSEIVPRRSQRLFSKWCVGAWNEG
jgi:hypothetical protein